MDRRYRESYFDVFPGVWRHGDWIRFNADGSSVIYGRSDATLNRGGVRMGTSDFYRIVEAFAEIKDSLVVEVDGESAELVLFVVLAPNESLDDDLRGVINKALRDQLSPRHAADRILAVPDIPKTLNGKKLEIPVKRLLMGKPLAGAVSEGAVANPASLGAVVEAYRVATAARS